MATALLPVWDNVAKPIIGMLHLQALPGSPGHAGDVDAVTDATLRDADALTTGGVDGLMLENFGDTPFFPGSVPPIVITHMTRVALAVRARFQVPLGINVLRNDAHAALAIAHAVDAQFIRVNVLCGARLTDQGVIQGLAHTLLRERATLGAERIRIFADVNVKHSSSLGLPQSIKTEALDVIERGGADALVVSGAGTGQPADLNDLRGAQSVAGDVPVFVGSGIAPDSPEEMLQLAGGFIVGSAFKTGGDATERVDATRVAELTERIRAS